MSDVRALSRTFLGIAAPKNCTDGPEQKARGSIRQRLTALATTAGGLALIALAIRIALSAQDGVLCQKSQLRPVNSMREIAHVAVNNEEVGVAASERLVAAIGGQGGIVTLQGGLDTDPAQKRFAGIQKVLARHADVSLLAQQTANWDRTAAFPIMQTWLAKYGDRIKAVWAANNDMALDALEALQAVGLAGRMPMVDVTSLHILAAIIDITTHKEAEAMLQQAHTTLEQRVEERTTALQQAEHFALLGRLAASVSHDLRNPLAAIVLQVEVLEAEWQTPSAEETAVISEAFTEIKLQLARLQELVQNYLSLARVTAIERTPQDLGALVQAWAHEWQHLAVARGVTFQLDVLEQVGEVTLHAFSLQRALHNLVQNALDAMPQGGTLTLACQGTETAVQCHVYDTGSGIPAEQLAQIFDPLYTTKPGGTGLGLYIVQEIVAAHRGQVTVHSVIGQGTTFTITLPCSTAGEATQPAQFLAVCSTVNPQGSSTPNRGAVELLSKRGARHTSRGNVATYSQEECHGAHDRILSQRALSCQRPNRPRQYWYPFTEGAALHLPRVAQNLQRPQRYSLLPAAHLGRNGGDRRDLARPRVSGASAGRDDLVCRLRPLYGEQSQKGGVCQVSRPLAATKPDKLSDRGLLGIRVYVVHGIYTYPEHTS
jgi:signal transduction histidine kinase